MKNSLITSILVCCLLVISTIGVIASATEEKVFQTNRVTHALNTQHIFPLTQNKIQKVEGKVRFYNIAENSFANHLDAPSQADKDWMVKHYDRMQVYPPYFDVHTEWYDKGLAYQDLYAIYNCEEFGCDNQWIPVTEDILENHPEWILRDINGNPLYLPFKCDTVGKGTCPQFAADISNPEFRRFWVDTLHNRLDGSCNLKGGYHGIMVDDVNLNLAKAVVKVVKGLTVEIVNGQYQYRAYKLQSGNPINQTTGYPIQDWEWAKYVAEFVELIRSEFQSCEIVHNSVWFHVDPEDTEDSHLGTYLDRQVDAADYIVLERGINDAGMTAGDGRFGVKRFLNYNDYLRERGRNNIHFIHVAKDGDPPLKQLEYGLAGWLLVSDSDDLFGAGKFNTPVDWWHGFDTNLGEALGDRYEDDQGLFRRNFKNGIVLVNGPEENPKTGLVTVTLPDTFYTLTGHPIDKFVLGSREGKILLRNSSKIDSFVSP